MVSQVGRTTGTTAGSWPRVSSEAAERKDFFHSLRIAAAGLLASFKVPREIELVAELPRTSTGKLQCRKLKPSDQPATRE